jgi:hypothetical protein
MARSTSAHIREGTIAELDAKLQRVTKLQVALMSGSQAMLPALQTLSVFCFCTTSMGFTTAKIYGQAWAGRVLDAILLLGSSPTMPAWCGV